MKLKKKPKIILTILLVVLLVGIGAMLVGKFIKPEKEPQEVKVLKTIDSYGYELKENKPKTYKNYFKELEEILLKDEVNNEDYVKKISEMFVYDFYSLNDKTTKADVGGVSFVHKDALQNFLVNAENTYYKYVESNLYGERKEKLQEVKDITISSITETEYAYNNEKNPAYEVKVEWTYTDSKYADYQTSATLIFIKDDNKYSLVELQ